MAGPARRGLLSVGKKIIMAITGLALCIYLVLHLAGNLTLLLNNNTFNSYASLLNALPFLIIIELGLLAVFLIHAYEALQVTLDNRRARPIGYAEQHWSRAKSDRSRKSFSSTTMMVTGCIILLFVALHVWHFKYDHPLGATVGTVGSGVSVKPGANAAQAAEAMRDLSGMVVGEFHKPVVVGLYVLAMLALGLHLWHAVSSSFQTLGVEHPRLGRALVWFGRIFTLVIAGGFTLLPLWVYLMREAPR